jgi:hypothetical protein
MTKTWTKICGFGDQGPRKIEFFDQTLDSVPLFLLPYNQDQRHG